LTGPMKVRGKPVHTIRKSLDSFCSDSGYEGAFRHFLMADGRSVSFRSLLFRPDRWLVLLLSLRRGPGAVVKLGIRGARVRVKNNIRIFYPADAGGARGAELLTAKVGLPSLFGSGSLGREMRARAFLQRAPVPELSVPRVLRYDRRALNWLEEEYLPQCADASAVDKARAFLDVCAVPFYSASVRSRELGRSIACFGIAYRDVRVVCEEAGVQLPDSTVTKSWPVALGHGDLSPGNMILGADGRLGVIDWERFGRVPVVWDLKKVALMDPARTLSVLEAVSAPGDIEPPRQLQIALAIQVVNLRAQQEKYLQYRREHLGLSRRDARARQSALEAELSAQIAAMQAELETGGRAATAAVEDSS